MSLYNEYANKPWMRPTMYTSDVDPSHQQQIAAGPSRITELVNGVPEVIEGREHYQPNEFGDGRPTGTPDRTPMVYRGPDPGVVIDIDDHDEMDTAPPQYVPHRFEKHFENVIPPGGLPPHLQPNQPVSPHTTGYIQATPDVATVPIEPAGPPTQEELSRDMITPRPDPRQRHTAHGNVHPHPHPHPAVAPEKGVPFTLQLLGITSPPGHDTAITITIGRDTYVLSGVELNAVVAKLSGWAEAIRTIRI